MTILDSLAGTIPLKKAKPSQVTKLGAFSRICQIAKTEASMFLE